MKKRLIILLISLIALSVTIWRIIEFRNSYLYMPYEYQESEIFWYKWSELKTPLRLEVCSNQFENKCLYSTNEEDIKFIIEAFWGLDYTTRSRKEFEELNYDGSLNSYRNRFLVVIRHLNDEYNGHKTGPILFQFELYTLQKYINDGRFYYFYELPDEVRDFIFGFDKQVE